MNTEREPAIDGSFHSVARAGKGATAILALVVSFLFFFPRSMDAQASRPTEAQVKAAYLYNFGKFVRWRSRPAGNVGDFEICVLGKDPLGPVLDSTVAGETLDNHQIVVRRTARPQGLEGCRILFIGASEASHLGSILAMAEKNSMLTVSDMPGFSERGGMIGFVTQDDRVRFEVNRGAAEQAGLSLSSELLKVATRVIGNGRTGGL